MSFRLRLAGTVFRKRVSTPLVIRDFLSPVHSSSFSTQSSNSENLLHSYNAHVLRRKEYSSQPWKNGLGLTHEIAIKTSEGNSSSKAPFDWRLSMADLRSPGGAFSLCEV